MNPSALIFLALAVAWAVYLVPKALKHHDEAVRSRSVERFSDTMRVLARREPVSGNAARLVVTPGRTPSTPLVQTKPSASAPAASAPAPVELTAAQRRARRDAANRAAARRRRVLVAILAANAVVIGVASFSVISWWWVAAPVSVLIAWLVACRLMVRQERGLSARAPRAASPMPADADEPVVADPAAPEAAESGDLAEEPSGESTQEISVVTAAPETESGLWDPVPVTLPTYVSKPAAVRRSVRTIDLEDSGVWTSGHTDADSQIAREAADAERAERVARSEGDHHRAFGS